MRKRKLLFSRKAENRKNILRNLMDKVFLGIFENKFMGNFPEIDKKFLKNKWIGKNFTKFPNIKEKNDGYSFSRYQ